MILHNIIYIYIYYIYTQTIYIYAIYYTYPMLPQTLSLLPCESRKNTAFFACSKGTVDAIQGQSLEDTPRVGAGGGGSFWEALSEEIDRSKTDQQIGEHTIYKAIYIAKSSTNG